MTRTLKLACLAVAALAVLRLTDRPGHAQEPPLGGPHDWSTSHLIAARFGPDADANIEKDWRPRWKHVQLDRTRGMRDATAQWLEQVLGHPPGPPSRDRDAHLDWSLRTGGFGNVVGFPAKYSFDITASNCSDVIYFTVDQPGSASAVNVIAITNAYAGCSGNSAGTTPTVKFGIAMAAGTATSATLSLDGKVLYVFESKPAALVLHAIQVDNITSSQGNYNFSNNTWTSTHTLATSPIGTASSEQLFQITFAGVTNNVASPYVDYLNNQLYFGDSTGHLYRLNNVNLPTAALAANFPVTCGAAQLQSPVFWAGQIVTASADGFLYRINTNAGTPYSCIASFQGGSGVATVGGGVSAPIVDVTNNRIVVGSNNSNGAGRAYGAFNLTFAAGEAPTSYVSVGPATTTIASVSPTFDDAFWSTNNGSLYVAGTNAAGNNTYLVRLPYNGVVGAIAGNAVLNHTGANAVVATSPVTEFLTAAGTNPDYIFIGGGSGNYKFMNRISSGFSGSNNSPSAMANFFAPAGGVISGIIVDQRTTLMTGSTATANIYFGTVGVANTTQSTIVQLAQGF